MTGHDASKLPHFISISSHTNTLWVSSAHQAKIQVPPISGQSGTRGCRGASACEKVEPYILLGGTKASLPVLLSRCKRGPLPDRTFCNFSISASVGRKRNRCVQCRRSRLVPLHTHRNTSRPEREQLPLPATRVRAEIWLRQAPGNWLVRVLPQPCAAGTWQGNPRPLGSLCCSQVEHHRQTPARIFELQIKLHYLNKSAARTPHAVPPLDMCLNHPPHPLMARPLLGDFGQVRVHHRRLLEPHFGAARPRSLSLLSCLLFSLCRRLLCRAVRTVGTVRASGVRLFFLPHHPPSLRGPGRLFL